MAESKFGNARDHAVVIGGGIAGLLAARVLAEHFTQVTLVERDAYPARPEPRKGVPQGFHVHALLAKGEEILSQLFPGLMPALIAGGAVPADMGLHFHWHHHGVWKKRFDSGIAITFFTRPFLEAHVAERVRALTNVRLTEGSVDQLLYDAKRGRVTGVLVRSPANELAPLHADLVVDATGRGSQTPQWLEALGYGRPPESSVRVDVTYASRLYQAPPGNRDWHAVHITSVPPDKRQGVIFAVEGDRLLATLVGFHGERPPTDDAGYLDYAKSLAIPDIHQAIVGAAPLTPVATYRFPSHLRRHYERLAAFPACFLVMGDAACSFNPIYGQGMTVSAIEAWTLDGVLRAPAGGDLAAASARFRTALASLAEAPWRLATGEDLRYPEAVGSRPPGTAVLHWYIGRLLVGCADDTELALAFYRVMHMLDSPSAFFRPRIMWRVLRGRGRTPTRL